MSIYHEEYMLYRTTHDRPSNEWFLNNLPSNPIILDIGSCDGLDSINFSRLFPDGKIFSFEPFDKINKIFKDYGVPSNVTLNEYAISNVDGIHEFWESSGRTKDGNFEHNGSGSLLEPLMHLQDYPDVKFENVVEVKTKRLDTWFNENNLTHIDFIWMDVQGSEHMVFEGAAGILDKIKYIYTETSSNEAYKGQIMFDDILGYLPGFKLLEAFIGDALFINESFSQTSLPSL
jgi:FkbM family methyltransferase